MTKRKQVTCFEHLSNEIMYEIFEYLDFYHTYEAFSKINNRFHHLINHSSFPIKVNLTTISKSTYQRYYEHIIIRYSHRITSIRSTNPFIFSLLSSPFRILPQFTRLHTLILENIPAEDLENILYQLISLPNLSSLTIIPIDNIQNKRTLCHQIFNLPVLNYCRISLKEHYVTESLPISRNQHSPIKHLVIDDNFLLSHLNILLTYLPELCRLTCNNLVGLTIQQIYMHPIVLKNLTYLSIKIENGNFDQIELFITKMFHQIKIFRFSTHYDIMYLNADRWEQLIVSNIPNLQIFNIELLPKYESNQIAFHTSINQFMSSFWLERKWFFRYEYDQSLAAFYSIKPYRRNHYTLQNWFCEDTSPWKDKTSLYSVDHISIRGDLVANNNLIYFPNVTKLTIFKHCNKSLHAISTILDRIIPSIKLYKLSIHSCHFSIGQLIELLYFSPNIRMLIIDSISFRKITSQSIKETRTFQTVSNENKITNLMLKEHSTLDSLQLFIDLCPRLEQLSLDISRHEIISIIQSLLLNNGLRPINLTFLCFLNSNEFLKRMIVSRLLSDWSIKCFSNKIYVWC